MAEEETCLIDEMLTHLTSSRQSMERQIPTISEIIEKSNNVLLQIEASRAIIPGTNSSRPQKPDSKVYTCSKNTILTLARIIQHAANLFDPDETLTPNLNENVLQFEQYLELRNKDSVYLSNCVRKLLTALNRISQVSAEKHNNSIKTDETT